VNPCSQRIHPHHGSDTRITMYGNGIISNYANYLSNQNEFDSNLFDKYQSSFGESQMRAVQVCSARHAISISYHHYTTTSFFLIPSLPFLYNKHTPLFFLFSKNTQTLTAFHQQKYTEIVNKEKTISSISVNHIYSLAYRACLSLTPLQRRRLQYTFHCHRFNLLDIYFFSVDKKNYLHI
jgi:hypothetical protein